jgi:cysteine-rich secretory family protein
MLKRAAMLAAVLAIPALPGAAFAEDLAATAQAAISRYRAEHGLPPVTVDPKLMALAAEQARAMAQADQLEHTVDRPFEARVASYDPDVAVENIAAGTRTFASTLDIWQHSPGHDANLRRAGVTRFGIASAPAPHSRYKIFWSLIMAGASPHHGVRAAGGPGPMHAGPDQGPVVRARPERTATGSSDVLATVKGWLKPLWPGASAK